MPTLLRPDALLYVFLAAVPIAAWLAMERRATHVRALLGLEPAPLRTRLGIPVALAATGVLLALAVSQPVVERYEERPVRRDAEAFFVFDISRSMLAAPAPDAATRFERAIAASVMLRQAIPDVRAGVASFTDRVVPHLFPTLSVPAFATTVRRAVAIDRPPPGSATTVSTDLAVLASMETQNYFSRRAKRRLLVVLTDGETRTDTLSDLNEIFRLRGGREGATTRAVFVHVWGRDEKVYGRGGRAEPGYRLHPWSRRTLDRLAPVLGGGAFEESELPDAGAAVRRLVASGPVASERRVRSRLDLARYLLALAFVPLGYVFWRRNLYGAAVLLAPRRREPAPIAERAPSAAGRDDVLEAA